MILFNKYNPLTYKWIYCIAVFILTSVLQSCSVTEDPPNIEPKLSIKEASDISRNEATIGVEIIRQGNSNVDFIRFRYGTSETTEMSTADIKPSADAVSFKLSGLKPGTRYYYCAEGGTHSATLRSEVRNFTTVPNERPTVSSATPLSVGPVGVIVGFELIEDGGEKIIEAGCEIQNISTGEKHREYLDSESLGIGRKQIYFNGLTPEMEYLIAPFASNTVGETLGESLSFKTSNSVRLENPGDLPFLYGSSQQMDIEKISISGKMNGTDFHFLRRMLLAPCLQGEEPLGITVSEVDITDVKILEGGESFDGSRFTQEDEISTGLFAECIGLKAISLPASAKKIGRNAFEGCSGIKEIVIPAGITEMLPSSDCIALEAINVSDANSNYKSIDGVLFNNDASEILWFPMGKKGEYTLPSSVLEIGENAFRETSITSLILPPELKSIARGAFSGSELMEISFPDNLTNISEGLLQDCSKLQIVRLGTGVEFIGNYAFDGSPLKDLYIKVEFPPFASENTFANKTHNLFENCVLHVPAASLQIYRNHLKWGKFNSIKSF